MKWADLFSLEVPQVCIAKLEWWFCEWIRCSGSLVSNWMPKDSLPEDHWIQRWIDIWNEVTGHEERWWVCSSKPTTCRCIHARMTVLCFTAFEETVSRGSCYDSEDAPAGEGNEISIQVRVDRNRERVVASWQLHKTGLKSTPMTFRKEQNCWLQTLSIWNRLVREEIDLSKSTWTDSSKQQSSMRRCWGRYAWATTKSTMPWK